jgi:hypothetical protein
VIENNVLNHPNSAEASIHGYNMHQFTILGAYLSVQLYLNYSSCVFLIDIVITFIHPIISLVLKKHLSCSHVVFSVRNVIDHYVSSGSTVNV